MVELCPRFKPRGAEDLAAMIGELDICVEGREVAGEVTVVSEEMVREDIAWEDVV